MWTLYFNPSSLPRYSSLSCIFNFACHLPPISHLQTGFSAIRRKKSHSDFCSSSTLYFPSKLIKKTCSYTRISSFSYFLILPSLTILQNTLVWCLIQEHFLFFITCDRTVGTFRVGRFFLWNTSIFWLPWHQIILLFLYSGFSSTWPLGAEIPIPFSLLFPNLLLRDLICSHNS